MSPPSDNLYIGLMSGTSTDGVDAALVRFEAPGQTQCLAAVSLDMPAYLRQELLALNQRGPNELERSHQAGIALTKLYVQAVHQLLHDCNTTASEVRAIGSHGQTIRHQPSHGYSIQIQAPALLAELTGIDVIADFRSRDIAAGGQGAPLVPAFHAWLFGATRRMAVVNLGGIANMSILHPDQPTHGFDTGPANMLLDAWVQRHTGHPYDQDGAWAGSGICNDALLQFLIDSEPWFRQPPPKSTGRDQFNLQWLDERLASFEPSLRAQDVQATLVQLTARTIADAIGRCRLDLEEVVLCGGGAHNPELVNALKNALPYPVRSSSDYGVAPQLMEAMAFAWLAMAYTERMPANLPAVTGARGKRILGCLYPA